MTSLPLALLLAASGPALALSGRSSAKGSAAAGFLELGASARGAALGEAVSAAVDDASALYWNPAALAGLERHSVSLMHAAGINASFFDYGAASENLGAAGTVAAGFQYLSAGRVTQTDDLTGRDIGTFSPHDLAATIGYGYRHEDLGGFSTGVSGKFIESRILSSAKTWAVDAGILSPEYLGRMRFAATAANFGGKLRFQQEAAPLPLVVKAGGAFKLLDGWLATVDVGFPKDNRPFAAAGSEYVMALGGGMTVAGRVGFNSRTIGDIAGFSGFSCGLGYALEGFSVDYAFLPFGLVGSVHRFSLSARWGGKPGEAPAEEAGEEETPPTAGDDLAAAEEAIAARDFAAAKKHLGAAVNQLGPKSPERARYLERLGYVQLQEGDLAEARKSYVEGIELTRALALKTPLAADLNAGLGFVLAAEGNAEFAVKFLRKALTLSPATRTRRLIEEKLKELSGL